MVVLRWACWGELSSMAVVLGARGVKKRAAVPTASELSGDRVSALSPVRPGRQLPPTRAEAGMLARGGETGPLWTTVLRGEVLGCVAERFCVERERLGRGSASHPAAEGAMGTQTSVPLPPPKEGRGGTEPSKAAAGLPGMAGMECTWQANCCKSTQDMTPCAQAASPPRGDLGKVFEGVPLQGGGPL
jgi:hypothetical protein